MEKKNTDLPKNRLEIIDVPQFKFLTIEGQRNPISDLFSQRIDLLVLKSWKTSL